MDPLSPRRSRRSADDPATLRQVAERAGVSIATVSRVVRGVDSVSDETRQRVEEAVAALEFRPNQRARALASRRHHALGVVFPGLSGPYYSEVIAGFEAEAVASQLSVLILGTHLLEHSRRLVLDMADRVDGIAVMGGSVPDDVVQALVEARCPVVQLAGGTVAAVPQVRTEGADPVRELTRHLIQDHDYERLAFVGNPVGSPDAADRWRGFQQAHRDLGVAVPRHPLRAAHDQAGGLVAADKLLAMRTRPRAAVCVNDETAIGMLITLLGRGIRVPQDVALTGFDDLPAASLTAPALTTVRQQVRELGSRTVRMLRTAIDGGLDPRAEVVLPTEVVRRASCGCAPEHPAAATRRRATSRVPARPRRAGGRT
ncbi:LacI family DNA-binding transcriptional regulator [Angustibacter peucedani]